MKAVLSSNILWICLGALMLMTHAFLNGYPIVYADTSTFLASGFELETPFDRPITYGIFIWLTSFGGLSLWGPIFFQSLILSFLIFKLTYNYLSKKYGNLVFVLVMACLSALTGVSWVASQLISDVFTPIMILSFALILIGNNSKTQYVGLYIIYTVSVAMHMSHVSIGVVLIFVTAAYTLISKRRDAMPLLKHCAIAIVLTVAGILTMGSALSKSKHAFLFAALVEHGIVDEYLDEHCDEKEFRICEFKGQLPDKAWVFLWDESSPFYALGDFKGTKEEFNEIINATLSSPKYLLLHLQASVNATFNQLLRFDMGDGNGDFLEGTLLHKRIATYVPHELEAYEQSRQNQQALEYVTYLNHIQSVVVLISILYLIWILIRWKTLETELRDFLAIAVFAIVVNAWACGTFANAIDRLGVKMIWVVVLVVIIGSLRRSPINHK